MEGRRMKTTTGQNSMNQLSLSQSVEEFTNDDYETPDKEAKAIASLVLPTDKNILEPFAGSGQIVKYLPSDRISTVAEIKYCRILQLRQLRNHSFNFNGDFFKLVNFTRYDLIITNPPFSLCMEAIAHSLKLLNPDNPTARLLFLIPLDTFSSQGRSEQLKSMDAHIHHTHLIPKRVDYLKDGEPMSKCQKIKDGVPQFDKNGKIILNSGRQCYDAVFDIRPGEENPSISFLY
jgi:hypothetical protein